MVKHKTKPTPSLAKPSWAFGLLLLLTLISTAVHATNITVQTSRTSATLDDSFHLIYEAESSVDDDPDFSPVYENFDVLSSSQSTNMRSVNGSWSLKKTWDLSVIAKSVGKFTIPPIHFGSDISPAIQIKILNSSSPNSVSPNGQATIPATIFLENEVNTRTGWVQSQIIYTLRLLRTVNIANASLTELTTSDPDAIIHLIAEDDYQTTRNGIRYQVIERRYAIYPQKSGTLKIKPITFSGRINATQPRSLFDQFRISGQLKRLHSKAINVTVKAAPKDINLQDWVPAREVRLIAEWSGDIQNLQAGEPITRTILIAAEGLTGVQLPDLHFGEIDGLKQYPDKPVIDDKMSANGITGYKQIKVALIPSHTGNYTLPEIKFQWWNTKTNKPEIAVLPQAHLNVTGTAITETIIAPPINNTLTPLTIDSAIKAIPSSAIINDEPYWKWLSLFFATLWLITLILYFKNKSSAPKEKPAAIPSISIKQATADVKKQAGKNNPAKTRDALIIWAQVFYNDKALTNLSLLTTHCSPTFGDEVRQLNATLYSPDKLSWSGKNLLEIFRSEKSFEKKHNNGQPSALKPLYNK